jgi:hypothetical protein
MSTRAWGGADIRAPAPAELSVPRRVEKCAGMEPQRLPDPAPGRCCTWTTPGALGSVSASWSFDENLCPTVPEQPETFVCESAVQDVRPVGRTLHPELDHDLGPL